MTRHQTLARFVALPENQSGLAAVQHLAALFRLGRCGKAPNPLLLHGPPGSGKTHLIHALANELVHAKPPVNIQTVAALAFRLEPKSTADKTDSFLPFLQTARQADLLLVEDLHQLPVPAAEIFAGLLDTRAAQGLPTVVTAALGPSALQHRGQSFPTRLTTRLAGGLVIGLEPLQAASRLCFLQELAQRRQLAVPADILHWLAQHLTGGGRQLEGAIEQLAALSKLRPYLKLATIQDHFRTQVEAGKPTLERIARHVSRHFQVQPHQLQSASRARTVLWPRQIGMFLSRQLTGLSFERIGAFFGGRDHTTVLHACRKVEETLTRDPALSGAVRRLHTELA